MSLVLDIITFRLDDCRRSLPTENILFYSLTMEKKTNFHFKSEYNKIK